MQYLKLARAVAYAIINIAQVIEIASSSIYTFKTMGRHSRNNRRR